MCVNVCVCVCFYADSLEWGERERVGGVQTFGGGDDDGGGNTVTVTVVVAVVVIMENYQMLGKEREREDVTIKEHTGAELMMMMMLTSS